MTESAKAMTAIPAAEPKTTGQQGEVRLIGAGELFRMHGRFVARFLWKMGCSESEIEDATQEVFLVAHRRGGFEPRMAQATTWLAEIALRTFRARRRKLGRRSFFESSDSRDGKDPKDDASSPEQRAQAKEDLQLVRRALLKVDESRRAILILSDVEGQSAEDIAKSLSIPLGTVFSRLSRGRRQFRDAFTRLEHQLGKGSL